MDIVSTFSRLRDCLISYVKLNNAASVPPFSWTVRSLFSVLMQYPAGITEAVLLTELEAKWRNYLRRGENSGKLLQVVTTLQLSYGDVLEGDVTVIGNEDSGRYLMRSPDGGKIELLMHEQFTDFIGFVKHEGYSLFVLTEKVDSTVGLRGRTLRLTQCNLLNSPPLPIMLLPTSTGVIELSAENANDLRLLTEPLTCIHNDTVDQLNNLQCGTQTTQAKLSIAESMMLGVFSKVLSISDTLEYPGRNAESYRVIKLQVPKLSSNSRGGDLSINHRYHFIYIVLYDDQAALGDLVKVGQIIYVYRPILTANSTEACLFGGVREGSQSHQAFLYKEVHRVVAPLIADYGDHESVATFSSSNSIFHSPFRHSDGKLCSNVHIVLGSISCLITVKDAASILPVTTALFQDYSGYSLQNSFEFRNDSLPSTSTLQKYNLKVNEQGTIDASECCGQINVHDYIPGLINVAMFARVVGIVRSKKGSVSSTLWLEQVHSQSVEQDIPQPAPILIQLECHIPDMSSTDRQILQLGQIIVCWGIRVEALLNIDFAAQSNFPKSVIRFRDMQTPKHEQVIRATTLADDGYGGYSQKVQSPIINVSAIAGLVTSPGIFQCAQISLPLPQQHISTVQFHILECKLSEMPSAPGDNNEDLGMKRKRVFDDYPSSSVRCQLPREIALLCRDNRTKTQSGLCKSDCLGDISPHIHAIVTVNTLSLVPSIRISRDDDACEIQFDKNMDYVMSLSRIDDVLSEDEELSLLIASSHYNSCPEDEVNKYRGRKESGHLFSVDCVAQRY